MIASLLKVLSARREKRGLGEAVLLNIMAGGAGRAGVFLMSLLQVPIALKYLGANEFGLWVALTNAVSLLGIMDFGIGNGIQNEIAEANGTRDQKKIDRSISKGLVLLGLIAVGVGIVVAVFLSIWLIHRTIAPSYSRPSEINGALIGLTAIFVLNLPMVVLQRACSGLQLGFIATIWSVIGGALILGITFLAARLDLGFTAFVVLAAVPSLIANIGAAITLRALGKWRTIPLAGIKLTELWKTLRVGIPFVLPQLGAMLLSLGPPLLITNYLGGSETAKYSIALKLLSVFGIIQAIIGASIWPAFTEAMAKKDYNWVKKNYRRMLIITAVCVCLPQALYFIWGGWALSLWVGGVGITSHLLIALGANSAVASLSQVPAVLLNSVGRTIGQATYGLLSVIIILSLMPYAIEKYGLVAVPYTTLGIFSIVSLPLVLWEAERELQRINRLTKVY